MKRITLAACTVLALTLLFASTARAEVDVGFFFNALSPYGQWMERPVYGWVWTPTGVSVSWRPYTTGHWVYTDEGSAWVADEEWGDIPFHYGRWSYDADIGWFWIPGTTWAPAWVAWRYGGGYVGWAPLGPAFEWDARRGFLVGGLMFDDIDDYWWSFVGERGFFAPVIEREIIVPGRNISLLRATRNATNYVNVNNRVFNRSVDDEHASRWYGGAVPKLKVRERGEAEGGDRRAVIKGGEFDVFRPAVAARKPDKPPQAIAPQGRPVPAFDLDREREQLINRQKAERENLINLHRQELERPPKQMTPPVMQQQQQRELNRLEDQHNRQIRQLERGYENRNGGYREIPY